MSNFMFLTDRLSMGSGVSVVVGEISKKLLQIGHKVTIAAIVVDYTVPGINTVAIEPKAKDIIKVADDNNADIIIAHTSPFFELLPSLSDKYRCWVWEHGDPSHLFFTEDSEVRLKIVRNKVLNVYPYVEGVIVISKFIGMDIGYKPSHVIYNGADHLSDYGKKTFFDFSDESSPLKIGTLFRLGKGESMYKGNNLYMKLFEAVKKSKSYAEFYIMGKGTQGDAVEFEKAGFNIHLNASDEERAEYLRKLDIFISPSLWEGFNLPIVEAMKSGTLAMAFDTGAHPEVCPFIFSGVDEMVVFIKHHAQNRALLCENSGKCYDYVNKKFTWEKTVMKMLEILK